MLRYDNIATNAIEINLENDYKVLAMSRWDRNTNKSKLKCYIRKNDNDLLDLIDGLDNKEIETSFKTIKRDVTKYITELHENKYFDYYISRYNYFLECFDRGNSLFEGEDKGWNVSLPEGLGVSND